MATKPLLAALLTILVGVPFSGARSQTLKGLVREDPSGNPIPGASVRLRGPDTRTLAEVLSDNTGEFVINLPAPGTFQVSVSRIGYMEAATEFFSVGPDDRPSLEVFLTIDPVSLDSLDVVGEARTPQLELVGFYRRLEVDIGHFILEEEIQRRAPTQVTDLFYGIPGARATIVNSLTGEYDVVMSGATTMFFGGSCFPTIVLDGVVVRGGGGRVEIGRWNELVNPAEIEAIEVYPSAAGLPVQYGGSRSPCGAILIWKKWK